MTGPLPSRPGPAGSPHEAGPEVPLGPVFQAEYRLLLRSVATRGRLLAVGALAVISILAAVVVALAGPDNPTRTAVGFVDGSLSTLVPVAVLVFGAATLGDLVDDGSLVYLWLRPVPTWCHVAAAWAATVTIAVPLVGVPTLVAAALIDTGSGLLVGATAAIVVAITCYAALFVAAGIVIRRALPWGLAYILIWEGFVASAGETASRLAIRSYVRSILSDRTGITLSLGDFTLASAVVVPLVVTAGALALATRRLARSDVA